MSPAFCAGCGLEELKKRGSRLKYYEHCERCRLVLYCSETCKDGDFVFRGGKCPAPFLTSTEESRQEKGGDVVMNDVTLADTSDEWETDSQPDSPYKAGKACKARKAGKAGKVGKQGKASIAGKTGDKPEAATNKSSDPSSICEKLERVKIDNHQPVTDSSDSDFVPTPRLRLPSRLKKSVVGTDGFETDSSTRSKVKFVDAEVVHEEDIQSSSNAIGNDYFNGMTNLQVFRQLVDCFRLYQDDEYVRDGEPSNNATSVDFNIFLDKAEASHGLLPTSWSRVERERCTGIASNQDNYPNIFLPVTETDLIEDYGNNQLILTTLRLLAERIYG